MTSTPRPNAGRPGLAVTALACVALTITGLGPASATPAASARRGPEPADTSGGLLYRTRRADFTPLHGVPGAAFTAHIGLNDQGQITGTYIDGDAVPGPDGLSNTGHRFVQDRRGHTLRFDVRGASITHLGEGESPLDSRVRTN